MASSRIRARKQQIITGGRPHEFKHLRKKSVGQKAIWLWIFGLLALAYFLVQLNPLPSDEELMRLDAPASALVKDYRDYEGVGGSLWERSPDTLALKRKAGWACCPGWCLVAAESLLARNSRTDRAYDQEWLRLLFLSPRNSRDRNRCESLLSESLTLPRRLLHLENSILLP